jgi:hypothetical protein
MATHFVDEYIQGRGKLQRAGSVAGFNLVIGHDGLSHTLHVADRELNVEQTMQAADRMVGEVLDKMLPEVSAKYQARPRPDRDAFNRPQSETSE